MKEKEQKFKQVLSLFIIFVLTFIMTCGCSTEERKEKVKLNEVPFAIIEENDDEVKAKLYYWDLEHKKIKDESKIMYTIPKKDVPSEIYKKSPISWDGKEYLIVVPSYVQVSQDYQGNVEKVEIPLQEKIIWGKGVKLISKGKDRYILALSENNKNKEMEMVIPPYFFKGEDGKEYSTEETGTIAGIIENGSEVLTLYSCFIPGEGKIYSKLFILKYDLETKGMEWKEVKIPEDLELSPALPPLPDNTTSIEKSFFIPTLTVPAEVDIDSMKLKPINNIIEYQKKYASETLKSAMPVNIEILGSYEDILFVGIQMVKPTEPPELYVFALKDGQMMGLLRRTEKGIELIDQENKVVGTYDIPRSSSFGGGRDIIFPNTSGTNSMME
ncbi:conserved hypothetical protein [Thermoanaerobacter italicus Ab9]|uniref:Lipoprotein n=1 Tax=Thermoanaerobacter italicus (strain DSM 9252 / Ab9) TaxID=580331 RepID=D3T6G1_THEIA|nr:hypothetical protein [Thermoanaerobacter italicus]ADD03555.1 conserved hypothetical protein [Thermoanaerobacter italicus Ab9]